jgi:CubicO group peptidase (beta-lactamase class C family)
VFTGSLLAKLSATSDLAITDPVETWLPAALQGQNPLLQEITLQHLATHTSGLPRLPPGKLALIKVLADRMLLQAPYTAYSDASIEASLLSLRPKDTPGERFAYSNYGAGVLGMLLAQAQQTTYENLLHSEICQPLSLTNTTITLSDEQQGRFALGHAAYFHIGPLALGLRNQPWNFPNALVGAGGIRSTGQDMLQFLKANMRETENEFSAAHQPLFTVDEEQSMGMGWFRMKPGNTEHIIICHDGATGGFRSFIGFIEGRYTGIIILCNVDRDVNKLGFQLLEKLAER